jgi:hypothetical protein
MAKPPKDTETSPGPAEKKAIQKRSAKSAGERKATKDETASALAPKSAIAEKRHPQTKKTISQRAKASMAKQTFDPAITQDAAVNAGLWVSPPDMPGETAVASEPVALQGTQQPSFQAKQ